MMASFGESPTRDDCQSMQKYPLKRLESAISNFIKVLRIDLERLHRHRLNMEKFQQLCEWNALNHEQINASRTVQQIHATIRGLQRTRAQVEDSDADKFDSRVAAIQQEATDGVEEFVTMYGSQYDEPFPSEDKENKQSLAAGGLDGPFTNDLLSEDSESQQLQEQLQSVSNREAEESYVHLKEGLLQLNSMIHQFSSSVHSQQEKVDNIEDNINKAQDNVQQGTLNLGMTSKLKAAIFPVAGALVGGVVGGPIGLIAGAKLGAAAAVGGGLLGFAGGSFWKKRQTKITETEMQNITPKRSRSLPDLTSLDKQ